MVRLRGIPTYDVGKPWDQKKGFNRAADWRDVQLRGSPSTHSSFPQDGLLTTTGFEAVVTLVFLFFFRLEKEKGLRRDEGSLRLKNAGGWVGLFVRRVFR